MASRIQKNKEHSDEKVEQPEEMPAATDERDKHLADIDALLDEIDEVLEVNAEEFVRNYVQKGASSSSQWSLVSA